MMVIYVLMHNNYDSGWVDPKAFQNRTEAIRYMIDELRVDKVEIVSSNTSKAEIYGTYKDPNEDTIAIEKLELVGAEEKLMNLINTIIKYYAGNRK